MTARRILGVLGGMGPLATVDFMHKVIAATPAGRDQDHVAMLVHSVPQVPDRSESIQAGSDEPLAWMIEGGRKLHDAGAGIIAIPCNTAHHWHDALAGALAIPVLHIVECAADALAARGMPGGTVGLLATTGTLTTGVYQDRLEARGYRCVRPDDTVQAGRVMAGIAAVKAGDLGAARGHLDAAARTLVERGCAAIVLGCTEIPVVLTADMSPAPGIGYLDATDALARAAVAWYFETEERAACRP